MISVFSAEHLRVAKMLVLFILGGLMLPLVGRATTVSANVVSNVSTASLPVVTVVTASRNVAVPGSSFNLTATATGSGPLTYQWIHNGRRLEGANYASVTLTSLTCQDRGWYVVDVSDGLSTVRSKAIFLAVAPEVSRVRIWGDRSLVNQQPVDLGTRVISVDAMAGSVVALRTDGTVASWGNISSSYPTPPNLSDVVAISAGVEHHVALKSDGTVVAWGSNGGNLLNIPSGLSDVVDIQTSDYATLALKSDGTVVTWGYTGDGSTRVPAGLTNVVAIAASFGQAIALKADGSVVGWGSGSPGIVDLSWLGSVKAIAGGYDNFAAIKTDGTVVQWSHHWAEPAGAVIWSGLSDAIHLAVGSQHVLALKSDGTVVGRGTIEFGETLFPLHGETSIPSDLGYIHAVDAGQNLSFALDTGEVALVAPTITKQPVDRSVPEGEAATFTVRGVGSTFSFLWERRVALNPEEVWASAGGSMGVSGESTATLSVVNTGSSGDERVYRCLLLNDAGYAVSNPVILTTTVSPVITSQPVSQTVDTGSTVSFSVVAPGATQFQWRFNGNDLPLANEASLTLPSVSAAHAGSYSVVVSNAAGSLTSDLALLTVNLVGYAAYNQDYFTIEELADADTSGPSADPDGDGISNLMEYALGLNPNVVDSLNHSEVEVSGDSWAFRYVRAIDRTDVLYSVETSTNLADWEAVVEGDELELISAGREQWRVAVPIEGASNRFFRLKVQLSSGGDSH